MGTQQLLSLDVTSNAVQLLSRPISEYVTVNTYDGGLRPLDTNNVIPAFTLDDKKIVLIRNNQFEILKTEVVDPTASVALVDTMHGQVILQAWFDENEVSFSKMLVILLFLLSHIVIIHMDHCAAIYCEHF